MMGPLKFAGCLAALALLGAGAAQADVKEGVDAWSRGDYDDAVKQWRPLADKGDPDAQFNLAQAYKFGRGVKQDLSRAEQLYAQAAAKGHLQAADNLGLLMFQRGDQVAAMPFIKAAAGRGDPRAQYILGLAHFNADVVEKDWVRAYALVSLAQQAGLPQAAAALTQMDQHIPLEQRQQSVALASQIAASTQANRERDVASADLGTTLPRVHGTQKGVPSTPPAPASQPAPATAGADFTLPGKTVAARAPEPAPPVTARPAPAEPPAPKPAVASAPKPPAVSAPKPASGPWRVQLGAFGVPGNADALWNRVKGRPELSGHAKVLEPAGRLTKLQAGGFASREDAQAACSRLTAAGFACIPVKN